MCFILSPLFCYFADKALVFTDFEEALKVLKTHKDARLKTFKNNRDALKFSQIGFESCPIKTSGLKSPSAAAAAAEKAAFRAPTKQELIQFRKAIEDDKYDLVEKTIWENPRYLVNVGDTPASLKDGTRYNALHVCAIHKRPRIAELIIKTISKVSFIELLHGKKNEKVCQEVCEILLDYYLNMPEKGRSETPLHLAVKFGAVEVVEVLTSYPQCKMTPNLDNMLPKDIICSRVNDAKQEVKDKIASLLDERFYVPVIRSVDNSLPPTIGEPFSVTNPPDLNKDPMSPEREIQAYAGPMNKEQAQSFRRRWKTPPRVSSNSTGSIANYPASPLKFPCSSTPQKASENNNHSPTSVRHYPVNNLFPNKSCGSELDDSVNGNYENKKLSPEDVIQNNNIGSEKSGGLLFNTPLRLQRKDLFLTYREQGKSPLILDSVGPGSPESNSSVLLETDVLPDTPLKERHLKLSDTEKGLELIGRELAKEQQVEWREYWDFLGCFVDISSPEGLSKLENYLKERKENEDRQQSKSTKKKKEDAILDGLCNALNNFDLQKKPLKANAPINASKKSDFKQSAINHVASTGNQTSAPYLCVEKSLQVFAKRMTKTILHNLESVVSINDSFNSELKRLKSLVCSFKDDARFTGVDFNLVHSRFANLIVGYLKNADNLDCDSNTISKIQKCFQQIIDARKRVSAEKSFRSQFDKKEQLQCVSEFILEYLKTDAEHILPENLKTEQICLNVWEKGKECTCHWENTTNRKFSRRKRFELMGQNCVDSSRNAAGDQNHEEDNDLWENAEDSSTENSDMEEDEEIFWSDVGSTDSDYDFYTPPESPSMLEQDIEDELFESYKIYLLGNEPTKRDLDVINALFNTQISRDQYPHIHRWRAAVLRHSLEERDNFPSPSVVAERRSEKNNISNRFLFARRLFSSPLRSFSSPSKQSDSSSGGDSLNAWRRSSDSSNNSFIGSSPSTTSRANLSLTFMNVSDI